MKAHVVFRMAKCSNQVCRYMWTNGPKGEIVKELTGKVLVLFHAAEVIDAIDTLRELQARKERGEYVPRNRKKRKQPD